MKIFYSIQATGNGHISRAMELLPYLKKYGNVDLFLSGENSLLELATPVKYRSKGLSLFYTCNGTLDYWKSARKISPLRMAKEVRDLPIENYDLIINDFECITALACAAKKIPSVNFGHQASFLSPKVPRPQKRSVIGEWILKNYARSSKYIGLHFKQYDDFILPPVLKKAIRNADPRNDGHITVYLPGYCDYELLKAFKSIKEFRFVVFSSEIKEPTQTDHIFFNPVNKEIFNQSIINCHGIITGAGFETPAEALFLKKKIMVIPIKGQYEQQCNAVALQQLGLKTLDKIDYDFKKIFYDWINEPETAEIAFNYSTEEIVNFLMFHCTNIKYLTDPQYPKMIFN